MDDPDWTLKLGKAKVVAFDFCTRDDFVWYNEGTGIGPAIASLGETRRRDLSGSILVCSSLIRGEYEPKRSPNFYTSFRWSQWTHLQGAFSNEPLLPSSWPHPNLDDSLQS